MARPFCYSCVPWPFFDTFLGSGFGVDFLVVSRAPGGGLLLSLTQLGERKARWGSAARAREEPRRVWRSPRQGSWIRAPFWSMGLLGPSWRPPGGLPGPPGPYGASRGLPSGSGALLVPSWALLGPPGRLWGPPGGLLGTSWEPPWGLPGLLVSSWGLLGPPGRLWGPPGSVLGACLGSSWDLPLRPRCF